MATDEKIVKPDGQAAFEAFKKQWDAGSNLGARPDIATGPWSDLPQDVRNCWQVAAQAVRDRVLEESAAPAKNQGGLPREAKVELCGRALTYDYVKKFTDPKVRALHGDHRVQIGVEFDWQSARTRAGSGLLSLKDGEVWLRDIQWTEMATTLKPGWTLVPEGRMQGERIGEILAVGLTYTPDTPAK